MTTQNLTPLQQGCRQALEEAYENAHQEYWAAQKRSDRLEMDVALSKVDQYGDRLRAMHKRAQA